jgi:competence protein ComFB
MSFKDDYDFDLLINETERLVIEELELQLKAPGMKEICKCQDCVMDMAALALNNLKPLYRATFTGVIYAQQFHQGGFKVEVTDAVKKGIAKVKKNPSHSQK